MQLRDFQTALVAELSAALSASRSVALQLPTGGGKTHIATAVVQDYRRRGKRIWFVCHRREIVQQTSRALEAFVISHGVVAYGHERWTGWQVQVCSVGSLRRAASKLPPPDLIVWDECHHVAASSWSAIKDAFPAAEHLGLTATPERLDGLGLADWFNQLICGPTTRDLIEQGHLSRYRFFAPTTPDLSGVGVWAGEYEKKGLAEVMGRPSLVGDIVEHCRRLAPDARAIAFCVSVAASLALVERFNEAGIPARHVDSGTTGEARDAAVADLASGDIRVLSNVEIFTEGFDLPAIDAVILARPTKSLALYRQMIGRGLRTADGKSETIILDHAAIVREHGLPDDQCEWSLKGKVARKGAARGGFLRRCPSCSAVHEFAAICAACGHEYSGNDRSLDEVDGTLIEIGRRPGHETLQEFADRIGRHYRTVCTMARKGLPRSREGFVPIDEALAWLELRKWDGCPSPGDVEYERIPAFAERVGRPKTTIEGFIRRGMPHENGWVHIPTALKWCDEDRARIAAKGARPEPPLRPAWAHPSIAAFIHRHGVTVGPAELLRLGLPVADDGAVRTPQADAWVFTVRRAKSSILKDFEPVGTFLRRVGHATKGGKRRRALNHGLPIAPNGLVSVAEGLQWWERHQAKLMQPMRRTASVGN